MSRALLRLRDMFDDPLLVRARGGFVLSPKAQALVPRVAAVLADMKSVFEEPPFDPAQEKRRIRIASTDFQTILFAPLIMARLAVEAPGIELAMEPYGPDLQSRMDAGTLDFAFALTTSALPPGAMSEPLGHDRLTLVIRRKHPAAKRAWTVADYAKFDHVAIAILGDGRSELDAQLAARGVKRRIALVTPHFMAALATVAASDLVTTVSEVFAKRFAKQFDLILLPSPLDNTQLQTTLVWSHVRSSDKVLIWFRTLIRDVADQVYGR
jgi:DNA-binding transcriptional LysR family regulator